MNFRTTIGNRYWDIDEIREFRNGWDFKFSGIVSRCGIGIRSVRTGRLVGKRYKVISNNQKITEALHGRLSQCCCECEHATFSEVSWQET